MTDRNLDELKNGKLDSNFFAMMARMKYINRWGLMRNTRSENIAEHSLEVAMIAHCLATIGNKYFDKKIDADHIAVIAMFHDATEIITGDMPTPIKYYAPTIRDAYKNVESIAADQLLNELPDNMREIYRPILHEQDSEYSLKLVKAADKMSALIKCIEERNMGNVDFYKAEDTIRTSIEEMKLKEADFFLMHFLPAYYKTLDDINE